MDTFEAIESRRAIKHYDPQHQMSEEDVKMVMSMALLSPTSFNIQNWRFIHVKDPAQRKKIREAAMNQAQITESSMLLVLCGDLNAAERDVSRYWKHAPKKVQDQLVPMIERFYKDKPQLQRDEVMRSVGMAAQTIMLSAKSMGYDSCPMIGFDADKVAQIIRLPKDHVIGMIVVIGKRTHDAHPRGGQLSYDDVILTDHF